MLLGVVVCGPCRVAVLSPGFRAGVAARLHLFYFFDELRLALLLRHGLGQWGLWRLCLQPCLLLVLIFDLMLSYDLLDLLLRLLPGLVDFHLHFCKDLIDLLGLRLGNERWCHWCVGVVRLSRFRWVLEEEKPRHALVLVPAPFCLCDVCIANGNRRSPTSRRGTSCWGRGPSLSCALCRHPCVAWCGLASWCGRASWCGCASWCGRTSLFTWRPAWPTSLVMAPCAMAFC